MSASTGGATRIVELLGAMASQVDALDSAAKAMRRRTRKHHEVMATARRTLKDLQQGPAQLIAAATELNAKAAKADLHDAEGFGAHTSQTIAAAKESAQAVEAALQYCAAWFELDQEASITAYGSVMWAEDATGPVSEHLAAAERLAVRPRDEDVVAAALSIKKWAANSQGEIRVLNDELQKFIADHGQKVDTPEARALLASLTELQPLLAETATACQGLVDGTKWAATAAQ